MKIIVGLGNPGERYARTRHNAGFLVVDALANELSRSLRRSFRFKARMAGATLNEEELLLIKPLTYMNNSGGVVASIMAYRKIELEDMIVVLDDADMDIGRLRVRPKGSSGGHKGLESVIQCVGSEAFTRVRVGIGRDTGGRNLVEYVLTPFSGEEWRLFAGAVEQAAQAVICVIASGIETAMNKFNGKG